MAVQVVNGDCIADGENIECVHGCVKSIQDLSAESRNVGWKRSKYSSQTLEQLVSSA
jgi:hypothetical protein